MTHISNLQNSEGGSSEAAPSSSPPTLPVSSMPSQPPHPDYTKRSTFGGNHTPQSITPTSNVSSSYDSLTRGSLKAQQQENTIQRNSGRFDDKKSSQREWSITCKYCKTSIGDNLQDHIRDHHGDELRREEEEKQKQKSNSEMKLDKHVSNTHLTSSPLPEPIPTLLTFEDLPENFKQQLAAIVEKLNPKCDFCNKSVSTSKSASHFLFDCSPANITFPSNCPICHKKKCETITEFNEHIQDTHKNELHTALCVHNEIVTCPLCSSKLHRKEFTSHVQENHSSSANTDEAYFVCPLCFELCQQTSLVEHVANHSEEEMEAENKEFIDWQQVQRTTFRKRLQIDNHISNSHLTSRPLPEPTSTPITFENLQEKDKKQLAAIRQKLNPKCDFCTESVPTPKTASHLLFDCSLSHITFPCNCLFCQEPCRTITEFNEHIQNKHNTKMEQAIDIKKQFVKCPQCHISIKKPDFVAHVQTHEFSEAASGHPFFCPLCFELCQDSSISKHFREAHPEHVTKPEDVEPCLPDNPPKQGSCFCGAQLTEASFATHMHESHGTPFPHTHTFCSMCVSFVPKDNFKHHLSTVHQQDFQEVLGECPFCRAQIKLGDMKQHVKDCNIEGGT
ncbi:hypothetical protein BLNAU_1315 [Blattamonas nauphoetae]|uniref:C2H2-type domain-containing protein n=1 Tax=Blattamonas nauphoetae TaxID=2049346 RepID=A0ABQ9YJ36_9EUKA|nr:hypothetical protein BLNAU_1315 [Blattamonas nauphoetae]